jgi:hypothetical protein
MKIYGFPSDQTLSCEYRSQNVAPLTKVGLSSAAPLVYRTVIFIVYIHVWVQMNYSKVVFIHSITMLFFSFLIFSPSWFL